MITGANASTWAGRAVEVEGDDRLVDAGLGVLAVAADLLLDGADARRRSARRRRASRRGSAASDRVVTVTVAGSRSTARQCSCSTATLRATSSGEPNRLQASA